MRSIFYQELVLNSIQEQKPTLLYYYAHLGKINGSPYAEEPRFVEKLIFPFQCRLYFMLTFERLLHKGGFFFVNCCPDKITFGLFLQTVAPLTQGSLIL